MEMALKQARCALQKNEVPVGCVFVRNEEIVTESHNLTNENHDPLAHAELIAIRTVDCSNCDVFITCEPCIMCYGLLKRLKCKVYFGCFNTTFGCTIVEESDNIYVPNDECIDLLQKFYKIENPNAPIEKRKIKNGKKNFSS